MRRLVRGGMTNDLADRWLTAWERSAEGMNLDLRSLDFWGRGERWAEAASAGGQRPPTVED
jgi:hypothetical protein